MLLDSRKSTPLLCCGSAPQQTVPVAGLLEYPGLFESPQFGPGGSAFRLRSFSTSTRALASNEMVRRRRARRSWVTSAGSLTQRRHGHRSFSPILELRPATIKAAHVLACAARAAPTAMPPATAATATVRMRTRRIHRTMFEGGLDLLPRRSDYRQCSRVPPGRSEPSFY
jgi:hypothetical protein